MIPPNYTSLLQSCDTGINKSLKYQLKQHAATWRRNRYNALLRGDKIHSPKRGDVLLWLKNIIVKDSFTDSGYVFGNGINHVMETESDSE